MSLTPRPMANPSDQRTLAAYPGIGVSNPLTVILDTEGPCAEWRLVEFVGAKGCYEVLLEWSAGGGAGNFVFIDVHGCSRVCVYARSLRAQARNLTGVASVVRVNVADLVAPIPTRNQWTDTRVASPAGELLSAPGSYSTGFRVELANAAALAAATIEVLDGVGAPLTSYLGNAQVQPWNPLGDGFQVKVTTAAGALARIVYDLTI